MAKTNKKPIESVNSSYTAIPHAVLDSTAFKGSSYSAKALLFELLRQHSGSNNGHFQLYTEWLYSRGWRSAGTIQKAKQELIDRGLIVKTRLGGLNVGADRFAVTWLDISNFGGLDITPKEYHRGAWQFMDPVPAPVKRRLLSEIKNNPVPESGTDTLPTVPDSGTKKAVSGTFSVPKLRNNEYLPTPPKGTTLRIVGRKGRSGTHIIKKRDQRNEGDT